MEWPASGLQHALHLHAGRALLQCFLGQQLHARNRSAREQRIADRQLAELKHLLGANQSALGIGLDLVEARRAIAIPGQRLAAADDPIAW